MTPRLLPARIDRAHDTMNLYAAEAELRLARSALDHLIRNGRIGDTAMECDLMIFLAESTGRSLQRLGVHEGLLTPHLWTSRMTGGDREALKDARDSTPLPANQPTPVAA